jgi:diguanylate cyclase (GGDEF)-like protein/PAS domain S-box-containing protein
VHDLDDPTAAVATGSTAPDAEQRAGLAFDNAPLGVALHSPGGDHIQVNTAYCRLVGRTVDELVGTPVTDLVHPEDEPKLEAVRPRLVSGEQNHVIVEVRLLRPDGSIVWARVHAAGVRAPDGGLRYTVSHVEDITERVERDAELAHQALHDPLTGLANRALLVDFLNRSLSRRQRRGIGPALLFIDLDRFKWVNDSLGHQAGDALLVAVARRLQGVVRPADLIARLGGDEFVIVLDGVVDPREPARVAERVRNELSAPIEIDGTEVTSSGSIGIAMASGATTGADGLLRDADAAMYLAKANGRNRFEIFDAVLRTQTGAKLRTESALRDAIDHGGLEVVYHPEVDLNRDRVVAFEALVRWNHPTEGWQPAGAFIELAEETGLIVELGRWVLHQVCREARRLPLRLRVNLSARQLAQADLVRQVEGALADAGIDGSQLGVEITEATVMDDPVRAVAVLGRLRQLGVEVALDDFGTGWTSLAHLPRLPVDVLKIDRSLVGGLGDDPDDTAVTAATIAMAHTLGLRVVAEGVETPRQLDELRRLGCDGAQGYLFARPAPAEQAWSQPTLASGDRPGSLGPSSTWAAAGRRSAGRPV